jgi:hypothetical protein
MIHYDYNLLEVVIMQNFQSSFSSFGHMGDKKISSLAWNLLLTLAYATEWTKFWLLLILSQFLTGIGGHR